MLYEIIKKPNKTMSNVAFTISNFINYCKLLKVVIILHYYYYITRYTKLQIKQQFQMRIPKKLKFGL